MLGADLPEAQRNRLLRRVDWRFLLPLARVDRVLCLADGDLRDGLSLIAREVVLAGAPQAAGCDLVVASDPDGDALAAARESLRPGGACYAESRVRFPWAARSLAGRLRAAGFAEVRAYLPWPSAAKPYVWIPLASRGAKAYFRRHLHAQTPARRLARRVVRSCITLGARLGVLGPVCFVGRKPGAPGEDAVDPAFVATVRQGWDGWI